MPLFQLVFSCLRSLFHAPVPDLTSDFFLDKVGNFISTFSSGGIDGEAEVEVGPLDLVILLKSAMGSISRFLTLDMLVMWL